MSVGESVDSEEKTQLGDCLELQIPVSHWVQYVCIYVDSRYCTSLNMFYIL